MNITIESLLADAKYLVTRLKDHDNAAELLAEQASTLNKEMEARNTYQENLIELNKVAGHRPRSTLVLGIQQENCAIRSLQQDNDELRQSLIDHQNALELIMTKYRQQMIQFTKNQKFEYPSLQQKDDEHQHKTRELVEKICEMASVMRRAAEIDDKHYNRDNEEMSNLRVQNEGLRELLLISKSADGAALLKTPETESGDADKTVIERGASEENEDNKKETVE